MTVIGAGQVESAAKEAGAGATLVVGPRDIVTPLARERAVELGVTITDAPPDGTAAAGSQPTATSVSSGTSAQAAPTVSSGTAAPTGPGTPGGRAPLPTSARPVDLGRPPADQPGPPSGAFFRRGGPVPAASAAPGVRTLGGPPAARGSGGGARARRVVVVGAGHVGMITALRLAEADVVDEVVLTDLNEGLAGGIALDIAHTSALAGFRTRLRGVGTVEAAGPAEYYVVTAGRPRTPGMSRTDLVSTNAAIVDEVGRAIARTSPGAVVVVVTNPLDEMTYQAWRSTGFPPERVVGMAGLLDTARFQALTAIEAGAAPVDVQAIALGSHGEEMVIPLSRASVSGRPLGTALRGQAVDALVERARGSGAEIVGLLGTGSAFMAPGTSAAHMVLAMLRDDGALVPAAVMAGGAYGLHDVYIGLPARLGPGGVREVVEVPLDRAELAALVEAAERVRGRVASLAPVG